MVRLVHQNEVEEVGRKEGQPALQLLHVRHDHVCPAAVLLVHAASLQGHHAGQARVGRQHVTEMIEVAGAAEGALCQAVLDRQVRRHHQDAALRNPERGAGEEARLSTARGQDDDGRALRRAFRAEMVTQGEVPFLLRRPQLVVAHDVGVGVPKVLPDFRALPVVLGPEGVRPLGWGVPLCPVALVAQGVEVEDSVLPAVRKGLPVIEVLP